MKAKLFVLTLVTASMLIPVGVASANAGSEGCQAVNDAVFDGLSLFGAVSGQTFAQGEVVTASGNEPSEFGDPQSVHLYVNHVQVGRAGFPGTVSYEIPADGPIGLVAWFISGGNATWDVSCAPASVDADLDGVLDADDACADTVLPDEPTNGLKGSRFAAQADGSFDSGNDKFDELYTVADTAGCSASQIIELRGLGDGHVKHGLSKGELEAFIASVNG